jgi:hypothetical protein
MATTPEVEPVVDYVLEYAIDPHEDRVECHPDRGEDLRTASKLV